MFSIKEFYGGVKTGRKAKASKNFRYKRHRKIGNDEKGGTGVVRRMGGQHSLQDGYDALTGTLLLQSGQSLHRLQREEGKPGCISMTATLVSSHRCMGLGGHRGTDYGRPHRRRT